MAGVNNEQALATFEPEAASTPNERLRAARFLAKNATNADQSRLSKIREAELNSWVRWPLDQALKRSEMDRAGFPPDSLEHLQETPFVDTQLHEELRARAIDETTAFFLHELRPLVGFLDLHAAAEIDGYACSRTKNSVRRIQSFLDAIANLRTATASPAIQEFDLTDLAVRVTTDEVMKGRATLDYSKGESDEDAVLEDGIEAVLQQPVVKLSLGRQEPVVAIGDPTLVEMAVANALRNAIESALEVKEPNRHEVTLNWGVTDTDNWIVVLDLGVGLPSGMDRMTLPGTSTKKNQGHLGMGLPIAQRAMESTGGSVRLSPRPDVGFSCEIRWPREGYAK